MIKRFNYIIIFCLFILSCGKNDSSYSNTPQFLKKEPLNPISTKDSSGFTEMSPLLTGVTAINNIGEKEVLENQHLMHGSGIALGDINNDGWVDIYVESIEVKGTKESGKTQTIEFVLKNYNETYQTSIYNGQEAILTVDLLIEG